MPHGTDSEATITAGKNKLANICIYGQIKSNDLLKDISGQLPNNSKQLARDLIAAAARVLRPDTTSELIRDILHYRSRKVRCMFKEWKSGKLDTPLEQRLIDCEKALLNTLELGANMPTDFMQNPDINPRSMEILSKMELYIMDANFRSLYIPTLPALVVNDARHSHGNEPKRDNDHESGEVDAMKGDQESDGDSVHASSSSFEDQCCGTAPDPASQLINLTYPEQLHAALLNSASMQNGLSLNEQFKSVPLIESNNRRASIISGTTTTGSSLNNGVSSSTASAPQKSMASRKRKYEDSQLEIVEMKKELIRLQQVAFERQIQMCDEIVGMLKEMRSWLEIQKRSSIGATNGVASLPQLSSLPNTLANYPLISNQLSTNLNTLTSLLANTSSPQFI